MSNQNRWRCHGCNHNEASSVVVLATDYDAAIRERDEAQKLVARMHEAAVGSIRGPIVGVVEDVAAVRFQRDEARAELAAVIALAGGYQRDANALRAAVEACTGEMGCQAYKLALPAADAPEPEPFHAPHVTADGQIVRTVRDVFFAAPKTLSQEMRRKGFVPRDTTVDRDAELDLPPLDPWEVECARCHKKILNTEAVAEEGDEWECFPCNERENERERLAATGQGEKPHTCRDIEYENEANDAIDYLHELLGWAYGRCVAFGLETSTNQDTVLRMDEIKLALANMDTGRAMRAGIQQKTALDLTKPAPTKAGG